MTQDTTTEKKEKKDVAPPQPVAVDLSRAIEQTVPKLADEEVRSVRVFGDRYRCNWWIRDTASHAMFALTTGRIRRSSFLKVTKTGDALVIEDLSIR